MGGAAAALGVSALAGADLKADVRSLFDHLVGAGEYAVWNLETHLVLQAKVAAAAKASRKQSPRLSDRSGDTFGKIAASGRARGQSDQLFPNHGLVGRLDVGWKTILTAPARILVHLNFFLNFIERLARLHHGADPIE